MEMDKKTLRKEMKRRIAAMGAEERQQTARQLFGRLEQLPEFRGAKTVLLYWSLPDEPDSHAFLTKWRDEKELLLPAVIGDDLELRRYRSDDDLVEGAFHIKEPIGEVFTDYDKVDLVVVPGLSFDESGFRLGRGKGYYDRLVPRLRRAVKVGFCFPCQFENRLPHDAWDKPMDFVLHQP